MWFSRPFSLSYNSLVARRSVVISFCTLCFWGIWFESLPDISQFLHSDGGKDLNIYSLSFGKWRYLLVQAVSGALKNHGA